MICCFYDKYQPQTVLLSLSHFFLDFSKPNPGLLEPWLYADIKTIENHKLEEGVWSKYF